MKRPIVLTIAGFDPSSGAGVTADLRTFHDLDCFGAAVITAVTYQNSVGVIGFTSLPAETVKKQFLAVIEDYEVTAVKIGMLGNDKVADIAVEISEKLNARNIPIIIDPVYESGGGISLYNGDWETHFAGLAASATLITPNVPELARLSGSEQVENKFQLRDTAIKLYRKIGIPILAKGGHIEGGMITDVLIDENAEYVFEDRSFGYEVHGTGCLLSAAITAYIARGLPLHEAVENAERYVDAALDRPQRPGRGSAVSGNPGDDFRGRRD